MEKTIIKRNGQTVRCYGDYSKFDTVAIIGRDLDRCKVFTTEIETTLENISNFNSWTHVVEKVTAWGKRNNCEIDEVYCN